MSEAARTHVAEPSAPAIQFMVYLVHSVESGKEIVHTIKYLN